MKAFLILLFISSFAIAEPPHDNHCKYGCGGKVPNGSQNNGNNPDRPNPPAHSNGNSGGNGSTGHPNDGVGPNVSRGGAATTGEIVNTVEVSSETGDSAAEAYSENRSANTAQGGNTDIDIIREYEAVAEAVHSLNLAHCSDGGGVSDKNASFNVGGLNFTCEASKAMGVIFTTVNKESPEQIEVALEQARGISQEVYDYIMNRGKTAGFGAAFRDLWWCFAILLVI